MSMDNIRNLHIFNPKSEKLRKITTEELYRDKTPRLLRSSIMLPSQYNSYAVCTEFARDWFLEKWPRNFFTSIYMDGSKSFDQFRMFSKIDDKLKKLNKEEKVTVIHITHYMNEVTDADYLYVMDKGRIALQGKPAEVFSQVDKMKEIGLDVPQVTELAYELRKEGLDISADILTIDEMVEAICRLR